MAGSAGSGAVFRKQHPYPRCKPEREQAQDIDLDHNGFEVFSPGRRPSGRWPGFFVYYERNDGLSQ